MCNNIYLSYFELIFNIGKCFLLIFFVKDYRKAREIDRKAHEVGERTKNLFFNHKFDGTIELPIPSRFHTRLFYRTRYSHKCNFSKKKTFHGKIHSNVWDKVTKF